MWNGQVSPPPCLLHPLLPLVMADPERLGEAPSPQRSPEDGELPKLVVIPSGSLHRVPFHALPLPFSRRPEWHAGTRLCDAFAVSYAAIADLLPFTAARGSSTTGLTTFAPGVAETPGGAGPERTVAMAAALASLSGSVSYLRAEATHDALLSAGCLAGAQVAIVATHGRAGTSFGPSRSGLLVHPGTTVPTQREPSRPAGTWVTTAEITSLLPLHLTGHLQLLACSTHADDPQPGDHLVGLLTALIVRGSRSVGATLWNVHEVPAILVGWLIGSSDAPPQTALLAAVGWLRIATVSDILHVVTEIQSRAITVLPPDDPACAVMRSTIHSLASIPQDSVPFHRTFSWAPFVLHGLPA